MSEKNKPKYFGYLKEGTMIGVVSSLMLTLMAFLGVFSVLW